MHHYRFETNDNGDLVLATKLKGRDLLNNPKLNKGCAFTPEERERFELAGLLPHSHETIEQQCARHYRQYESITSDIKKNIYLNVLMNHNETLFFKLISENLEEMLPIIYTPTVGKAVENYSLQFRRERGLYISYPEKDNMAKMLGNKVNEDIDLLVITDGDSVLGIGDQGVGGIAISVGKMIVYALFAGIPPHRIMPIQLDVGTNNPGLLDDPGYLGWHHSRVTGKDYDDFVDHFVEQARKLYPNAILHWEDFDRLNAAKILERYKDKCCTFNDDMQGTGAVTLACILAALAKGELGALSEQRFVIHGAGTAAIGVADQLVEAMVLAGEDANDARNKFWLLNSKGLLTDRSEGLNELQQPYCQASQSITHWTLPDSGQYDLLTVVKHVQPTILIGCSTVNSAFDEAVVTTMASYVPRPVILPLSNPSDKSEAVPQDLYDWSEGRALVATGSPFPDVEWGGDHIPIAQCNNAFVYPGLGLGLIAAKAQRLTSGMLIAASTALADYAREYADSTLLLPPLSAFPEYSKHIALAVAKAARSEGYSKVDNNVDLAERIDAIFWRPEYHPLELSD